MDGDNDSNNGIPTQEYIRRAMEDNSEFDEDFTRNPWFCALEYLGTLLYFTYIHDFLFYFSALLYFVCQLVFIYNALR